MKGGHISKIFDWFDDKNVSEDSDANSDSSVHPQDKLVEQLLGKAVRLVFNFPAARKARL